LAGTSLVFQSSAAKFGASVCFRPDHAESCPIRLNQTALDESFDVVAGTRSVHVLGGVSALGGDGPSLQQIRYGTAYSGVASSVRLGRTLVSFFHGHRGMLPTGIFRRKCGAAD